MRREYLEESIEVLLRTHSPTSHAFGVALELRKAWDEAKRLEVAILTALNSAEAEGIDRYRGTDEPREFVTILREAVSHTEEA